MSPKAHLQWWAAVIMLVAASLYVHTGDDNTSNARPPDVQLFPARLGAWNCVSSEGTKSEHEDQNVDKFWKAKCQKGASQPLDVFIGYSFHAGKKGRLLPPLVYFGQQEWDFPANQSVSIDDENQKGKKLNLMQRLLRNPQGSKVALSYWYQLSGNSYAYRCDRLSMGLDSPSIDSSTCSWSDRTDNFACRGIDPAGSL